MSLLEQLCVPANEIRSATKLAERGDALVQLVRQDLVVVFVYERYQRFRVELMLDGTRIENCWCGCGVAFLKAPCRHVYAAAAQVQLQYPEFAAPGVSSPTPAWRKQFKALSEIQLPPVQQTAKRRKMHQFVYLIDIPRCTRHRGLVITVAERRPLKDGSTRLRPLDSIGLSPAEATDPIDRQILAMLRGARYHDKDNYGYSWQADIVIDPSMYETLIPTMAATGRLLAGANDGDNCKELTGPLAWDGEPAWEFCLRTTKDDQRMAYVMEGTLQRDGQAMDLRSPLHILNTGLLVLRDRVARHNAEGSLAWIAHLHKAGQIAVPFADAEVMLRELLRMRALPRLEMPEELRVEERLGKPEPRLLIRASKDNETYRKKLRGELTFDYGVARLPFGHNADGGVLHLEGRCVTRRNPAAEKKLLARLLDAGFTEYNSYCHGPQLLLSHKLLPAAVLWWLIAAVWLRCCRRRCARCWPMAGTSRPRASSTARPGAGAA